MEAGESAIPLQIKPKMKPWQLKNVYKVVDKQDIASDDDDEDADDEGHDLLRVPSGDTIDYHLNSIDEWFVSHHLRVRLRRRRRRR